MSKRIPYAAKYLNTEGYAAQTQEENASGDPQWVTPPDETAPENTTKRAGKPRLIDCDTYLLLRDALRQLQRIEAIAKPDDARRVAGVFNAIDQAEERNENRDLLLGDKDMMLGDKSYEWLHAALGRAIPVSVLNRTPEAAKEAKERGDQAVTFGWLIWRNNAFLFQNALRDRSDTAYVDPTKLSEE